MRTPTVAAALLAGVSLSAVAAEPTLPHPLGSPGEWITDQDYPAAALREEAEGVVRFTLSISVDGTVTDCTIQETSNYEQLDATTCALLRSRARFAPALDAKGHPTTGTYSTSVRWQIPQNDSLPPALNVSYRVVVEKDGSVSACEVLSDTHAMAEKTCSLMKGRTFDAPRNDGGTPVRSATTITQKVERTELPD